MRLVTEFNQLTEACQGGTCLCIGMFDGVHRGHQMLMDKARQQARLCGLKSLVFTFCEHPLSLLAPPYAPLLLTGVEEKIELIGRHGIDLLAMIDFTPEFAAQSAREFLEKIVAAACQARYVACGCDFRFGARGAGDARILQEAGKELGFEVEVCDSLADGNIPIKSTRIRQYLLEGKIEEANRLLGHPYTLYGRVVEGDRRGRSIGFPTANIETSPRRLIPGNGVYAVRATVGGQTWAGMMNIGVRPTFNTDKRTIEVHLLDFEGDLYGKEIAILMAAFIREERRFPSVEALIEQLNSDRETCRTLAENV